MSLPERIELEIVTPDRLFFSGEVDEVTLPGAQGYFGILPGHAALLSELDIGVISYRRGTDEFHLFCSWGFVEVLPDRVSVLAEAAESPDQIDVEQAKADKERAEQVLRSREAETDYTKATVTLREAVARLDVAERTAKV
ncbi:F0F1 ATP synthase subunit epsilon [Acidobacteria bacterium AH-259-O06]|nr:F0F1 ATP synthase subunit epsilon [Acidobacteria bacterium AH-259-O06]